MSFTIDPRSLTGDWNYPAPIRFGPGRIRELARTCAALGIRRPLLRPAIEEKMIALARYLGLGEASFAGVVRWILGLRERIGIPRTLTGIGVPSEAATRLAPMALADPSSATNPVHLSITALESLFENALEGRLETG